MEYRGKRKSEIDHHKTYEAKVCDAPYSELGEGPVWDNNSRYLYWVDIDGASIHRLDPSSGAYETTAAPKRSSVLIPCTNGEWIVAAYHSLYYWKGWGTAFTEVLTLDLPEHLRFNDGKVGPDGAIWIGTFNMRDSEREGSLYRIDSDFCVEEKVKNVYCSNGLGWSQDFAEMYYIDSGIREIRAYRFDAGTGQLGEARIAVEIPETIKGVPDGMCVDHVGTIWVAMWGGSCITNWNPKDGALLGTVEVPVLQPSCCTFGSAQCETLFVTTAQSGLNEDERSHWPLSGSLFEVQTPDQMIKGINPFRFEIKSI